MVALFDFDGVVMNTEPQYTVFWDRIGLKYLGCEGYGMSIKGQTLKHILTRFSGLEPYQRDSIVEQLNEFERDMPYPLVNGVLDFMADLKSHGVKLSIVTSSTDMKMQNVYRACPQLMGLVDRIYTSEDFSRSKPDPECFLLAMKDFDAIPSDTVIFEDSVDGLKAARATCSAVIGLVTTNVESVISPFADRCIPDFVGLSYEDMVQFLTSWRANN